MASPIELKLSRIQYYGYSPTTIEEITLTHTYNAKHGNGVDDITESIPLQLTGTQSEVQSTINKINLAMDDAAKFTESGYGDRVYIMSRAGTALEWRRSPVVDGRLSITNDGVVSGLTSGDRTPATLSITRAGYFENVTGVQIPFYNSNGTVTDLAELNLFNCNSGAGTAPNKLQNYALVNSGDVLGDLPAPVSLIVSNSAGGATPINKYIVSLNSANYGTVSPSYYFVDFSGTADASCSGGSYATSTLSTSAETDMFTANIVGLAQFMQYGGAPFHVMARFRNNTSLGNVKFRLKFQSGTTTVWSGPQFILPNTNIIQDLGVINLPPGNTYWGSGNLVITGQRTTGSSETIGLDFIQFFGGSYAELNGLVSADSSHSIVFGGYTTKVDIYRAASGGVPLPDWYVHGTNSLMLQPGKTNMLLVLSQTSSPGTAEINHLNSIEASYRPRWSSPL
jgi:hypothetical protein